MANSQLDRARRVLPETARALTQVVVDNPGQFVLIGAGGLVFARILVNAVRPRTPLQALATLITGEALAWYLTQQIVERGILKIKVRDAHGKLVPLVLSNDQR